MATRNQWNSWTVIGAGHGGQALAGYLALKGERVSLWNRTLEPLEPVRRRGGVELEGAVSGFGRLEGVGSDLEEALDGARFVLVAVPASAHREMARAMAPYLQAGQTVVLNPGRTLGALEFQHVFRESGAAPDILVAETDTFIFASRRVEPGVSRINRVKKRVRVAAVPAYRTGGIVRQLRRAFPQMVAASSVLETGLSNIGAIFHPAPTLLNSGWIESDHSFEYYHQGISPGVARALERLDEERLRLADLYGVTVVPAHRWLSTVYGSVGTNLHEAIQRTLAYRGLEAPGTLRHRYLYEDIPASLVPLADLARAAGRPAELMESLIVLGGALTGANWWLQGRTLASVGMGGFGVEDIVDFVNVGLRKVPHPSPHPTPQRSAVGWRHDTALAESEAALTPEAH